MLGKSPAALFACRISWSGTRARGLVAAATLATLLAACQQQVSMRVDTQLPAPLVEELPITVGVYYPNDFREHEYAEASEARGQWQIASGESHMRAFARIFGDLFEDYRELDSPETGSADLVVVPRIERMQFSTPEETGFGYYETWIEYVLEIRDGAGSTLPTWRFTGYGQAPRERFGSTEDALNRSLSDALRNAGATLATGLPEHPPVRALLGKGQSS